MQSFKRNIVSSNVIVLFIILPTLTDAALSLFQWTEIDNGDFRVTSDFNMVCYSPSHVLWCFMLSIPMLAVWVFGTQGFILYYLFRNKKRLNTQSVKKYFHILYIGYRDDRFYWEFVNTFKKFVLISINVFMSQISKSYKGMAAIVTIIVIQRIQIVLKPYKLKVNNEVENASMVGVGFTIFGGLLFMKGQATVSFIEAFAFILIITINTVYIMFWVYLVAKTYEHKEIGKRIAALLKIVLFRDDNDTVLTVTDEKGSLPNENKSKLAPIEKKHVKGLKHVKKEIIEILNLEMKEMK